VRAALKLKLKVALLNAAEQLCRAANRIDDTGHEHGVDCRGCARDRLQMHARSMFAAGLAQGQAMPRRRGQRVSVAGVGDA
jgi:hypothetical protein